jgi:hypothetical protein
MFNWLAGIPTIRTFQKRSTSNLQNLSTVATFFSAGTVIIQCIPEVQYSIKFTAK